MAGTTRSQIPVKQTAVAIDTINGHYAHLIPAQQDS